MIDVVLEDGGEGSLPLLLQGVQLALFSSGSSESVHHFTLFHWMIYVADRVTGLNNSSSFVASFFFLSLVQAILDIYIEREITWSTARTAAST